MKNVFILAVSLMLAGCATTASEEALEQPLSGDELRTAVTGMTVTFADNPSATGYGCYIFQTDGRMEACSGEDGALRDYGRYSFFDDRVCSDFHESHCWQFFRGGPSGTMIRHFSFRPEPVNEAVYLARNEG